jgi:putative ABC transport system permease protein
VKGRWLVAGLARWRDDRAVSLVVAALVLVSAIVVALTPRLLQRVADDALRSTVAAMPQPSRGIQLLASDRIAPDMSDPLARIVETGSQLEARLPARVRGLVTGRSLVVDTPRYLVVQEGSRTATIVTLRFEPGALERVRFTGGRAPAGGGEVLRDDPSGDVRQVYEVALSAATARRIGVGVGDLMRLDPDTRDPTAVRFPVPAAARVVGIFVDPDPTDPAWFGDLRLDTPSIRAYSSELQYVDAVALLAPAAYPRLILATREPWELNVDWRLDVDPGRVTVPPTDALLADLRRLAVLFPTSGEATTSVEARTDLTRVVGAHLDRWHSASLVLAVAAIGTALVGLAALALVARLAARRRRQTVAMWIARGATRRQVVTASMVEAALIVVPPALLAVALAVSLLPHAGAATVSAGLALLVALAAGTLLVGADIASAAPTAPSPRAARSAGRRSRRGAVEATIVILAVAGVILLRQRAAPTSASTVGTLSGPDPFMAAVPALVGIAAGLVVMRGFRFPMGILSALAPRWRGIVPALAIRRATRGGASAAILLVLMATTTVATFAATTLAHLDEAAAAIAWHDVGADLHVSVPTAAFPAGVDLARVPGVAAVADVYRASVPLGDHGASVELLAIDPAALERVVAGTPADAMIVAELAASPSAPLPAIVSTGLIGPAPAPSATTALDLSIAGKRITATAVEVLSTVPTIPLDTPAFVVVSRPLLEALVGARLPTTDALVRAPAMTAAAFRAAIATELPGAQVDGRAETEMAIRHSPIVDAVTVGIVLAAAAAAAYAAVALIAALALASGARAAETAHLRTLGLSTRQSVGLVVVEHLPAVAVAFAAGAILGLATFAIVEPGLGLDALLGSALSIPLRVDAGEALAVFFATALITAVAVAVGAALETSAAVAPSIRRGIG